MVGETMSVVMILAELGQNRAGPQGVAARIAASIVARLANIDMLAAPRFALPTILATNARAFHYVRDSRRRYNGCYNAFAETQNG